MVKRFGKAAYEQLDIAFSRIGDHRMTDWAAALTYYSVLSIFPGLLALVSLLGLIGHGTLEAITETVTELPDGPGRDIVLSAVNNLQNAGSAATTALIAGSLIAIYSASSYVGAFIRAAGVILGVEETRRFFVTIPLRLGLTILLMISAILTAFAIVMTGPIAEQFTKVTGVTADGIGGWGVIKWPIVVALFLLALGLLYSLGPNFENKRYRYCRLGAGARALADRFSPVQFLCRELWPLRQGLWQPRRCRGLPDLALHLEHRGPARTRIRQRTQALQKGSRLRRVQPPALCE
jgi:membrane protein